MWADMGYQSKDLKELIKKKYNIDLEIVKRPPCRLWVPENTPSELLATIEVGLRYNQGDGLLREHLPG